MSAAGTTKDSSERAVRIKNRARPKVRAQIHPRALAIVETFMEIPEGYSADGIPLYRGIPQDVWEKIAAKPALFNELLSILQRDYPTFAALVQKIWAKKVGHLVPFIFNKVQTLAWNKISNRIAARLAMFIFFLKARQMGLSTMINGMEHWQVWRLTDIESNLIVHEKPLAYAFVDRLRIFHEELPNIAGISRTLRSQTKTARVPKNELYYNETRSKITTVVAGPNVEARGRSALHNHLAEYAFYDDAAGLLSSLMPQLPPAGSAARLQCSVFIETTPNGKNDAYDLWQICKSGDSEWGGAFYAWYVAEDEYSLAPPHGWKMSDEQREWAQRLAFDRKSIDGIDRITPAQVYWYEQTLETECGGDQDKMDREYPSDDETCFLMRSRSIFKHDMRYLQSTVVDAERKAPEAFASRNIICKGKWLRGDLEYPTPDNPFGKRMPTFEQLRIHPKFVERPTGLLTLWAPPQEGHEYVVGIDSASGLDDSDNSVGEVIDVTKGYQIGEYAGRVPPEKLADDSVALGYFFNTALLYPEINSIGVVTMKRIKQLWQYPRLGREEKWDEIGTKPNKYGHYTTDIQKEIMVSFLLHLVRERYLGISSEALLSEMSTFVQKADGSYEADANNKDDRVMGLALACIAIRQAPKMLASITKEPHRLRIPEATDAMIHDAPIPTPSRLPEEIEELLRGADILAVPANPIRGTGLDLPW